MRQNESRADRRIVKTEKSVSDAFATLLQSTNFAKITVSNICETAQISRAAFYTHFNDKYDLLRKWLVGVLPARIGRDEPLTLVEARYSRFLQNSRPMMKNVLIGADTETAAAFSAAIAAIANVPQADGKTSADYAVYYNFYIGGITHYWVWMVSRNFPAEVPPMNQPLYEILLKFQSLNPASEENK